MILTTKHLAVIRAALEYWDDEMSPHAPAVYAAYFAEPIGNGEWIKDAVSELRTSVPACRLRYALCPPTADVLLSNQLFETPDEAGRSVPQKLAMTATVLLDLPSPEFSGG